LESISTQTGAAGTREDGLTQLAALLGAPLLEDGQDVGAKRRTSRLSPLAQTADVRAGADLHVFPAKRGNFAISQSCLDREEEERPVAPAYPCSRIRDRDEGSSLPGLFKSLIFRSEKADLLNKGDQK
jgi:hypothetical protein